MSFFVCSGCSRHIKGVEDACPFCGAVARGAHRAGHAELRGARTRQRLLFGAATVAVAGATAFTGCGGAEAPASRFDAGTEEDSSTSGAPLYGGPMEGGSVRPYGVPAFDAGTPDSGTTGEPDASDASDDSGDAT